MDTWTPMQATTALRRSTPMREIRRERSAVTVLALVMVVVVATAILMLARFGSHVASVERAAATADVVALAAVTGGDSASREVARANGASLESLQWRGMVAVVHIELGGETAVAAARPAPR